MTLTWGAGDRNMTTRLDWLDVPDTPANVAKLEAAAGATGDWMLNDFGGHDWWGLHGTADGTADGHVFTVYSHKSGTLKIGGFDDMPDGVLAGLKAALLAILGGGA